MPTLEHIQRAAFHLLGHAKELLHRALHAPATLTSRAHPNPARARRRITHALEWAEALARTLSGAGLWLLPTPRRPAPLTNQSPPPRPVRDWPEDPELRRIAARRRTIRRAFATTPTNVLARRIATRLGVTQHHDAWPADILSITETPAEFARTQRATHTKYFLQQFARAERKADRLFRLARAAYAAITPKPSG